MSVEIARTRRRGLEPANPKLLSQYESLCALLAKRLTPAHAALLAEPVALGAETAWYANGQAIPLQEAEPEVAAEGRRRLSELTADIEGLAAKLEKEGDAGREYARLLRDALVVPGNWSVWLTGDGPVLVDWGWRAVEGNDITRRPLQLVGVGVRPDAEGAGDRHDAAPPAKEPAPSTLKRAPEPKPPIRRPWLALLFWALHALFLILLAAQLLRACAIGQPDWPPFLRALLPDRCIAQPTSSGPSPELAAAEAAMRAAERDIAARLAACGGSCPASSEPIPPRADTPNSSDLDRRLTARGAERGAVEVTLAWNGASDLDLFVQCPGNERLGFNMPSACKGRHVIDVNASDGAIASDPIEHIIWNSSTDLQPGSYRVIVNYYRSRNVDQPVDFTIVLRHNNVVVREVRGRMASPGAEVVALNFEAPEIR